MINSKDKSFSFDEEVKSFCKAVLNHSSYIGVRGYITQDYLNRLGFRDVKIIGCPSMYMFGKNLHLNKIPIAIDINSEIAINGKVHDSKQIKEYLFHSGYNYSFVSQTTKELKLIYSGRGFGTSIDEDYPSSLNNALFENNRIVFPLNVKQWLDYLSQKRLSIGTRIHGNIAAVLAGTPAFVICTDTRTLELCEFHEIPHCTESQFNFKRNLSNLFEDIDWESSYKNHAIRYNNFIDFLKDNDLDPNVEDFSLFDSKVNNIEYFPLVRPLTAVGTEELSRRLDEMYGHYDKVIRRKNKVIRDLREEKNNKTC